MVVVLLGGLYQIGGYIVQGHIGPSGLCKLVPLRCSPSLIKPLFDVVLAPMPYLCQSGSWSSLSLLLLLRRQFLF